MFDWDDARVFAEAARSGTLARAAHRLGMDAATVGRRIARLETALKATLVVRARSGLNLTAAGSQFLEAVQSAERAMTEGEQAVRPDTLGGTVRISASEGFGTAILATALPRLLKEGRGLRVELAANSGFLSPTRREVDLAITLSQPDASRLVAEPLTDYQLALYAAPDYLAEHGAPSSIAQLNQHTITGYVEDLIYAPELNYLDEVSPGLHADLASSSIRAQQEIIASAGAIGVLPCFMAEGLTRILPDVLLKRRFWLSIHRDLADTARIRTVTRWIRTLCDQQTARLNPYRR